jgi:hypothetical protein
VNPLQNWLHSWSLFFQGADVRASYLWGVQVLWWGRIGKLLTFFAGLVIVLDVVGPSALNRATERSRRGLMSAGDVIAKLFAAVLALVILGAALWVAAKHPYNPPQDALADNPDNAPTNPWFLLVVVVGGLLAAGVWWAVPRLLFWMLQHDRVARVATISSLGLFVVGFHFDLLAS